MPPPHPLLVEDEPSGSGPKRRKNHVDPIVRDWSSGRQCGDGACTGACARSSGCAPECFPNTPYRWKRSAPRAAPLGRKTLLSPADVIPLFDPRVCEDCTGAAFPPRPLGCDLLPNSRARHKGGHDIHSRFQYGSWPAGHARADPARGQDRRRLAREQPWSEHTHHITFENDWATTTTTLQLTTALDDVLNPSKEGQAWILPRDMASIHASEATLVAMRATFPHVVLCCVPSNLQPCDLKPSSSASRAASRRKRPRRWPALRSTAFSTTWS